MSLFFFDDIDYAGIQCLHGHSSELIRIRFSLRGCIIRCLFSPWAESL